MVWFKCKRIIFPQTHTHTSTHTPTFTYTHITHTHKHTLQHSHLYNLCIGLVVLFGMVVCLKRFAFGFPFWLFHNILDQLKMFLFFFILEATFSQLFPTMNKNKNPEHNRRDKKI